MTRLTLSVDEAALMRGESRAAAYRCIKRGQLRGVQLGRRIVIPVAAVDELLPASAPPAADISDRDHDASPMVAGAYPGA